MECWNTVEPEYRFVILSETKDLVFADMMRGEASAEFILSDKWRFFASLRMTSEGLNK